MCTATTCRTCGKTTWAGCGQHVGLVRAGVPTEQWCAGHARDGSEERRWLGRLLGR